MSHCRKRCKRQLTKVARYFYRFLTGTLTQGLLSGKDFGGSVYVRAQMNGHVLTITMITSMMYTTGDRPLRSLETGQLVVPRVRASVRKCSEVMPPTVGTNTQKRSDMLQPKPPESPVHFVLALFSSSCLSEVLD
ncbi:hypothetical protein SRHO_G00255470 [Serrasalmus rhombeus]